MANEQAALEGITARIKELLQVSESATWEIARLLSEARQHFESCDSWVQWARAIGIGRRDAFRYRATVGFLEDLGKSARRALLQRVKQLDFRKVAELVSLGCEKLDSFLQKHPPESMTRDELRLAVAVFLNRPPSARFSGYGRLPPPEQLTFGLDDPKAIRHIDFDTEVRYVAAHMQRISIVMGSLDNARLVDLRRNLAEDIEIIDRKIAGIE